MWPNPQFAADLVTFTEEIIDEKTLFLVQCMLLLLFSDIELLPSPDSMTKAEFQMLILKKDLKFDN